MYVVNKLEYKTKENKLQYKGSKIIKTFKQKQQAELYIRNCRITNLINSTNNRYTIEKIGI